MSKDFSKLVKYAGFVRTATGPVQRNVYNTPTVNKASMMDVSAIPKNDFGTKLRNILGQTAGIGAQVGGALGRFVVNTGVDIARQGYRAADSVSELFSGAKQAQASMYREHGEELGRKQDEIMRAYKDGRMTKDDYIKSLNEMNNSFNDLNKENDRLLQGPTPAERGMAVVETAANVLSLGNLQLSGAAGKQLTGQGAKQLSKETVEKLITSSASKFEGKLLESKAFRSLVERNIQSVAKKQAQTLVGETAWQYAKRNSREIAMDLLVKRPIFYEQNIGQTQSLWNNILEKDYQGALTDVAWLSTQMLNGGPIGAFFSTLSKGNAITKRLARGKESFIDNLSSRFGTRKSDQIAEYVAKNPEAEKTWRIIQESNMRATGDRVPNAVDNFMSTYSYMNEDQLAKLTPEKITQDIKNWYDADQLIKNNAEKFGMKPGEAARLTPVRWDAATRTTVADAVRDAGDDKAAQIAAINAFSDNPSAAFTANQNLMDNLTRIIETSETAEIAAKRIQAIDAAVATPKRIPKKIQQQLAKLGYTVAEPQGGRLVDSIDYEDTRKLVSGAIKDENLFDPSAAPAPVFKQIASTMERFGVSPEESNRLAYHKVSESVAANLRNTAAGAELGFKSGDDVARGGEVVLSKLQQYVENKEGVRALSKISAGKSALVDIRQMTLDEIADALKYKVDGKFKSITRAQAKEVRNAIMKGYMEVPLEMRGLGDKVTDVLYQYNPLHKYYSRLQSSLRYTYNPFFRLQESSETKILSKAKANSLLWNKTRAELDDAAKILDEARIFSGQLPGEATNDMVIGRITANLTQGQKRDLAGLALDIADSQGKDLAQLAAENPEILDDALRVVVQYPRKGVISSPLARTLNLVFFPMRYNAKVTAVAAQALAKQPPVMQKAVLHSLFQFRNWLKSDEGIDWQAKNADAISLFNWITPVNSIKSTLQLLSGGVDSPGDMGQLGGLPLGIITQILDGQGVINLNRPYVDPKTGKVFPDYVPETTKARAATALVDVLNTTFTYPGRVLGLPGKNETLRGVVRNFIETEGSDFEKRIQTDRLTPLQQNMVRVLKGDTSDEAIDALYNAADEGEFRGYTLPPYNLPIKPNPPELPKKVRKGRGKGKRAKTYARAPGPR